MDPLALCPPCCICTESPWWRTLVSSLAAKQGFIDTDDFFVLNESSAKVTLLNFIMLAAFYTVSPRQHGCLQMISGCSLRCCFPSSVISPYHLVCYLLWFVWAIQILSLQKLLVPSNIHQFVLLPCPFANYRCPRSKDVVQSSCSVQFLNITE